MALGGALVLTAVPGAQSANLGNTFTCSATAVRVGNLSLGEANVGHKACEDADGDVLGGTTPIILQADLGTVDALFARTDASTDAANNKPIARSESGVLVATLNIPTLGPVTAQVLTSEAYASCTGTSPNLTGDSTIVALQGPANTNLQPVNPAVSDTTPELPVPGVGDLHLSYQSRQTTSEGEVLTQRALFFDSAIAGVPDVVIGEAVVDRHGTPCGTTTGNPNPTTGNPTTGNPTTGNPTTGNPTTGGPTSGGPTSGGGGGDCPDPSPGGEKGASPPDCGYGNPSDPKDPPKGGRKK